MSAAVNSITSAQSDSIGRGVGGLEFREESDSLESRATRSAELEFNSIAFEIAAPKVTCNRSSSTDTTGSELRVRAGAFAASGILFGDRARSCPARQCGALGCGSNASKIKSSRMSAV